MKKNFLDNEMWILTIGGAFQRANIYVKGTKVDKDRENFRSSLKSKVLELANRYVNKINEQDHLDNIEELILSCRNDILNGGQLGFGPAQKLLNLYLKYEWCRGIIAEPPHCPVDRIVLSKLKQNPTPNWTMIKTPDEYMELVQALKGEAKKHGKSLAEWELEIFNRRSEQI